MSPLHHVLPLPFVLGHLCPLWAPVLLSLHPVLVILVSLHHLTRPFDLVFLVHHQLRHYLWVQEVQGSQNCPVDSSALVQTRSAAPPPCPQSPECTPVLVVRGGQEAQAALWDQAAPRDPLILGHRGNLQGPGLPLVLVVHLNQDHPCPLSLLQILAPHLFHPVPENITQYLDTSK